MLEHDLHWDGFFSELVYDILRPFYKKNKTTKVNLRFSEKDTKI